MVPVIYHGTPVAPRAALEAIGPGRAFCVSFFHPQDVEAVEAISPAVMFRQWRILRMDGGPQARRAMVYPGGLDTVLRLAGASSVHSGTMGRNTGCAGSTIAAQRQPAAAMAVRGSRCSALAYGWSNRAVAAPVRKVSARLLGLDRRRSGQGCRMRGLVSSHGRCGGGYRKHLAGPPHDARRTGCPRVSFCERGRHERCSEWMAL